MAENKRITRKRHEVAKQQFIIVCSRLEETISEDDLEVLRKSMNDIEKAYDDVTGKHADHLVALDSEDEEYDSKVYDLLKDLSERNKKLHGMRKLFTAEQKKREGLFMDENGEKKNREALSADEKVEEEEKPDNRVPITVCRKLPEKVEGKEGRRLEPTEEIMALKYTSDECFSCDVSTRETNLCCIGGNGQASLYKMDSGDVIHQVYIEGKGTAVFLSTKCNTFWTGSENGSFSVWNVDTGEEEWGEIIYNNGWVEWIGNVGEHIACGVRSGWICIIDEEKKEFIRKWNISRQCLCYTYISSKNLILAGHREGHITCWNITGEKEKTFTVTNSYGIILRLYVCPETDNITYEWTSTLSHDNYISFLDLSSGKSSENDIDGQLHLYDAKGKRILCNNYVGGWAIMVYGVDQQYRYKVKAHSESVNRMCIVPGTSDLLTAADDGSMLFTLPSITEDEE